MTNRTSTLDNVGPAEQVHQLDQGEKTQEIIEAMRNCLQVSLTGEAQNFRSWVAAAHRKSRDFQRLALATTAGACLLGSLVMLASIWQAHRITQRAAAQTQYLQQPAAASQDSFAELRQQNWQPTGKLITQKGRTFIELKAAN